MEFAQFPSCPVRCSCSLPGWLTSSWTLHCLAVFPSPSHFSPLNHSLSKPWLWVSSEFSNLRWFTYFPMQRRITWIRFCRNHCGSQISRAHFVRLLLPLGLEFYPFRAHFIMDADLSGYSLLEKWTKATATHSLIQPFCTRGERWS